MGKSKAKSPRKGRGRRTETHGKREANGRINARSESRGDKIEHGRTLASMTTTTHTSSTIKRSEVVTKIKEIVGAPMPKTESAKLN